jgi:hypothetical protein
MGCLWGNRRRKAVGQTRQGLLRAMLRHVR